VVGEPAARGRSRSAAQASPLVAVDGELLTAERNAADAAEQTAWDEAGEQASSELLEGLLYLNLGKRDGLKVPDVARLLRDSCELSRGQIGRIRVRDRYTFVDVPEDRLDSIIATLSGQVVHDRPLAPERAKTAKS
jgi:ATP-dependent RNA helicase DeaD